MKIINKEFYNRIKEIADNKENVKIFVDMDGTIVEYNVFDAGTITTSAKGLFINNRPIIPALDTLEEISKIKNVEIYILSLCRSNIIEDEKNIWLDKFVPFVKKENRIIVNKEKGQYSSEERLAVKGNLIVKNLNEIDYGILLDDDHKILQETKKKLGKNGKVFHATSIIAGC